MDEQGSAEICSENLLTVLRKSDESCFLQGLNLQIPPLKPCCQGLLKRLTDVNLQKAVLVSQRSTEWHELRRLRITGQ